MPHNDILGIRQIGLALIILALGGSVMLGGNLLLFLNLPALLTVCGITIGTVLMTYGSEGMRVIAVLPRFVLGVAIPPDPRTAAIARAGSRYALVGGSTGTLIGIMQMLGSLDNPSNIGPGIALALLAMLYAVLLAELLLNPLAARLCDGTTIAPGEPSQVSARAQAAAAAGISVAIGFALVLAF